LLSRSHFIFWLNNCCVACAQTTRPVLTRYCGGNFCLLRSRMTLVQVLRVALSPILTNTVKSSIHISPTVCVVHYSTQGFVLVSCPTLVLGLRLPTADVPLPQFPYHSHSDSWLTMHALSIIGNFLVLSISVLSEALAVTIFYWTSEQYLLAEALEIYCLISVTGYVPATTKILEVTADGQSVSVCWFRASIWSPWPDSVLYDTCGFLDKERPPWREDGSVIYSWNCFWVLPEQSLSGSSPAELMTIFCSVMWDSPKLGGQVPVFLFPRNRVAHLYSPGTGFPFFRLLWLPRVYA
jgi:hypothetical protein